MGGEIFRAKNFLTDFDGFSGEKFLGLKNFPKMKILKTFFSSAAKKYFFSELRNFFGYSFDVEKPDLSISDVFITF